MDEQVKGLAYYRIMFSNKEFYGNSARINYLSENITVVNSLVSNDPMPENAISLVCLNLDLTITSK